LDNVFPGFELGEFVALHGSNASHASFVLCVRSELPPEKGGLGSPVVFVDCGNTFNPYLIVEVARSYGVDPRVALEKIYVSRAFTAYQLTALILEKLEPFLNQKEVKLVVVSSIASLFLDDSLPRVEAKGLFLKVCAKLSELASKKNILVLSTYLPLRGAKRDLFFAATLFARSNVVVKFETHGDALSFAVQDQPRNKHSTVDFSTGNHKSLMDYAGALNYGKDCSFI
jgi:hypothetical protein